MARHGENIRKRKDGRWEGRYLVYREEKGKQVYRSVYGRTYEEVKEKLFLHKGWLNGLIAANPDATATGIVRKEGIGREGTGKEMNSGKDAGTEVNDMERVEAEISGGKGTVMKTDGRKGTATETDGGKGTATETNDGKGTATENNDGKGTATETNGGKGTIKEINGAESAGKKLYVCECKEKGIPMEEICFGTIAEEWIGQIKITRKVSTYIKYRLIYRNYLEKPFQDIEISAITGQIVQEKISGNLSESVGKSIYCVLNQIIKYASGKYALKLMPLKRPMSYMPKKPAETFSRKEQSALFSVLYQETDSFRAAILLCLYTGMRLGEVCALKWEDIDEENRLIVVRRTVQRLYAEEAATKTALLETAPKSMYSRREIPLPFAVAEILKRLPVLEDGKMEYVFGGNKPVDPRTMQNHFKQILKKAGIFHKNFHILRHTFSTNCIEGGTDVKSLSEILGHSDVQITLNQYVHPSMEIKRRHLDMLSEFYGQISGQVNGQISGQMNSQSHNQSYGHYGQII